MNDILSAIGKAIIEHAPEAFDAIAKTLAGQGIDLGPMTPDARADFAKVDEGIDVEMQLERAATMRAQASHAELARHDTDPVMPAVRPESER